MTRADWYGIAVGLVIVAAITWVSYSVMEPHHRLDRIESEIEDLRVALARTMGTLAATRARVEDLERAVDRASAVIDLQGGAIEQLEQDATDILEGRPRDRREWPADVLPAMYIGRSRR